MTASLLYRHNAFASVNLTFGFKAYNTPGIQPTFTGGAEVILNANDRARFNFGYRREDVIHNQFAIIQATQADVFFAGASTRITRDLEASAGGRFLLYTDGNMQAIGNADLSYTILRKPGTLKVGVGGVTVFTKNQSQETYENGELASVKYPYWTPNNYFQAVASLAWDQSLAPDAYAGQRELSYGGRLWASYDTTENFLVGLELHLRWEIVRNLILEAAGNIQRSQDWNAASATIGATCRF